MTAYTIGGVCRVMKKRQYVDRRNALAALDATAKRVGEDPMTWNAYVCKRCGSWHIGHIKTRKFTLYTNEDETAAA